MKKIIFYSLIIVMASAVSCKKSLNEEIFSDKSPQNFYKTEADAEAAIASIYNVHNRAIGMYDFELSSFTFMPSPHSESRVPFRQIWADYSYGQDEGFNTAF